MADLQQQRPGSTAGCGCTPPAARPEPRPGAATPALVRPAGAPPDAPSVPPRHCAALRLLSPSPLWRLPVLGACALHGKLARRPLSCDIFPIQMLARDGSLLAETHLAVLLFAPCSKPGISSTCFQHRQKRSPEADPLAASAAGSGKWAEAAGEGPAAGTCTAAARALSAAHEAALLTPAVRLTRSCAARQDAGASWIDGSCPHHVVMRCQRMAGAGNAAHLRLMNALECSFSQVIPAGRCSTCSLRKALCQPADSLAVPRCPQR